MRVPSKYSPSWRRAGSTGFAARRTRRPNVSASFLRRAVRFRVVRDPAQAPLGRRYEERPDRRVGEVIRDVEQPRGGRGLAEALVERGGDGHCILLLSLRTPDEAA